MSSSPYANPIRPDDLIGAIYSGSSSLPENSQAVDFRQLERDLIQFWRLNRGNIMEAEPQYEATAQSSLVTVSRATIALASLAVAAIIVSIAFIELALPFLGALALAAICAVLAQPFYRAVLSRFGQRQGLASTITVLVGILLAVGPLIGIGYLAVTQAAGLVDAGNEIIASLSDDVEDLKNGSLETPNWVPFHEQLVNEGPKFVEKTQELMGAAANFLASSLSGMANGTASFFLSLFTFLYALFFFLPLETSAFRPILSNSGLAVDLQDTLHDRIISVSRATIKGTLLIGVIQGALGGLGFWLAGIEGAAFWAVVMAIAAAVPGIGATGVVIGAAIYLLIEGPIPAAIGLALWGFLVVGTIDNVLRPTLVGRDAKMSDFMIFVSTLGGLAMFGASGLIFGPVIAGLFIAIWQAISASSLRPDNEGGDPQQRSGEEEPTSTERSQDSTKETPKGQSRKLTVSKTDLETELEMLKRELDEGKPS